MVHQTLKNIEKQGRTEAFSIILKLTSSTPELLLIFMRLLTRLLIKV